MKLLIALAGLLVAVAVAGGLALATVGGSSSDTPAGVDVSGPCDEAEHANDPRWTGAVTDDEGRRNRGPGGGGDDHQDRSGPSGDSD